MQFKKPKDDHKYLWTNHVFGKMMHYGMSEGVVKRVVNSPDRSEEGVAENTVAVMKRTGSANHPKELWVMYQKSSGKRKIISAWRYPGVSPIRDKIPIPDDILMELAGEFDLEF